MTLSVNIREGNVKNDRSFSNLYSNPKAAGFRLVDTLGFTDQSYSYDFRAVWEDVKTGVLYTKRESGCSCPMPFEYVTSLSDMERVRGLAQFKDEYREAVKRDYSPSAVEFNAFVAKVEKALVKQRAKHR